MLLRNFLKGASVNLGAIVHPEPSEFVTSVSMFSLELCTLNKREQGLQDSTQVIRMTCQTHHMLISVLKPFISSQFSNLEKNTAAAERIWWKPPIVISIKAKKYEF